MKKNDMIGSQFNGVCPVPSGKSDWGGTTDGYSLEGGQKADGWELEEVTTVSLDGSPTGEKIEPNINGGGVVMSPAMRKIVAPVK